LDKACIVDSTLREGEQTPGVHFTLEEKISIARELDRAGVALLDAGMPSVSAEERDSITAITSLGLAAPVGVTARLRREEVDLAAACGASELFLICPVSPLHIRSRLGLDADGLLELAADVLRYGTGLGFAVNLVAEDASRAEPAFVCDVLKRAHAWGACRAMICDTVGIMDPFGMKTLIEKIRSFVPEALALGVHCHDDLGLATANTIAAAQAGATCLSVTVNGLGERAGNAPLHEVIVALEKLLGMEHGIDMHRLYVLSRLAERCSGMFLPPNTPVVGYNAFRHETGIHIDGLLKNSQTYTGLDPAEVNCTQSFVLGKHTGTSAVRHMMQQRGYGATGAQLDTILRRIKEHKAAAGKGAIRDMADRMEHYYENSLNFPGAAFWEIVEEVLGRRE